MKFLISVMFAYKQYKSWSSWIICYSLKIKTGKSLLEILTINIFKLPNNKQNL